MTDLCNKISVSFENGCITLSGLSNFVLSDIFDCGQCFRFNKMKDGSYGGVAYGKYIELSQAGSFVKIKNAEPCDFENIWKDFFDLDFDYEKCINDFNFDKTLTAAAKFAGGIRILHQEHWETLCSFIISQNNNIPRIKKIIETLCRTLGDAVFTDDNGNTYYSFPTAEKILEAGEKTIYGYKTGFRAKYIIDAAKKVVDGTVNFEEIEKMDTDSAIKTLCSIYGVGPKVASCVLLFSFRKYDCFPVDVWVKKILKKYYPEFPGKEYFGQYAGIAQQYLFYYERCQRGVFLN